MPFRVGPTELAIILVMVLAIFGAGKLSQVGGALGKSIKEFRTASSGEEEEARKPSRNGVASESNKIKSGLR